MKHNNNNNSNTIIDAHKKIKNMEIRGAGRIGRAVASALKEYSLTIQNIENNEFKEKMIEAGDILKSARPTAVSLPNAVNYVLSGLNTNNPKENIILNAEEFIKSSSEATSKIGKIGSNRIKDGWTILTHCNSEAAISVIKTAHNSGKNIKVICTETRPRNQGYLTAKALADEGIDTTLIVDSAVRYHIKDVDIVVVGADAITSNGCLVNKIGSSQIALMAYERKIPFLTAAETYKFHPKTIIGETIEIEERAVGEIHEFEEKYKDKIKLRNPAFDITPSQYIDGIITEIGIIPPQGAWHIIEKYFGNVFKETL
ncbi:putative translation initiation factor, aIF-2BII family [Methanococcus aeolicus Nankai-3]|jgi:ribose 1,5-bisphosphate isomerase|uniref:Ribose 1,5-bisphosphate isomerase n=1 Tax=Methanococcus aeolicus (strain ATCC BAA-1280 / DSM 17508 / OCM 812 / Nankai-3) TaxID=419665 RepID=A6UUT5_META3|nr:ribose 1,5-bisphosphate isomerase [Methanococcus aeolicus]ABR56257.1 putative translation initiation factor, aIF-2BII family [Methanococcus aeolicus Nankai-3]